MFPQAFKSAGFEITSTARTIAACRMNADGFSSRSSTIMSARVVVLGAAGRFGHRAAEAFRDAGWTVASLVRPGSAARAPANTEVVEVDALDHDAVGAAARGADVVLHALNPSYTDWSRRALPLAYSAITAAETAGATLVFPGNLYNYGLAAAAGNRREYPHAAVIAEGTVASGDRRSHGGSGRARCTHHHSARGRLLWRWTRLVVRPRAHQGDRPRPCHLSRAARPGARMGLSARPRFHAFAPCRRARNAPTVRELRLSRSRRHRPRIHQRDRRGNTQQASSRPHDLVAHPCVAADRAALSRVIRNRVSLERTAPHRGRQAQGGDRRHPAHPA